MTEFSRPFALDRLGPVPMAQEVEASESERVAIASRLGIPAVGRLVCRFRLRRAGETVIAAAGELEAEVTQVCVVSLDEFAQTVREAFTVEFVPRGSESDDADPEAPDQIPYEGGALDLGEAATEQLALALDPYPHKVVVAGPEEAEPAPGDPDAGGPFAGLAALRGRA
ncbi:MAG: DUF177 domain-containing protein [Acetobacteraceae bacterium]